MDSPWGFLAPWCEELRGRLKLQEGYVRVLPMHHEKFDRFFRDDYEEEDEVDWEEEKNKLIAEQYRTREAIELLILVAHVDRESWYMLLREKCGLLLPGERWSDIEYLQEGSEEEWSIGSDEDDDIIEVDGDFGGNTEGNDLDSREPLGQEVLPKFSIGALFGSGADPNHLVTSPVEEWRRIMLADLSDFKPSLEYLLAKKRILKLQSGPIEHVLETPTSLSLHIHTKDHTLHAGYLKEVTEFITALQERAQKYKSMSTGVTNDTVTFIYRIDGLSCMLSSLNITDLFATRMLELCGTGVHFSELEFSFSNQHPCNVDDPPHRSAFAKLLYGMMLQPLQPYQKQAYTMDLLRFECDNAAPWQLKALFSVFPAMQMTFPKVCFWGLCGDDIDRTVRRGQWKMITKCFFRLRSCNIGHVPLFPGLKLFDARLEIEDLKEITTELEEMKRKTGIAQQWEILKKQWNLREGAMLQFAGGDPVRLSFSTSVELLDSHDDEALDGTESTWLNVLVPCYGQCRVQRNDVSEVVDADILTREPLRSLSLGCFQHSSGVRGLINQIGWSLHSLSLNLDPDLDVDALYAPILTSCPKLTRLAIFNSFIDLDRFVSVYEEMNGPNLSALEFRGVCDIGDGEGKSFAKRLGDPTSRLAKHLTRMIVTVHEEEGPPSDTFYLAIGKALETNDTLETVELQVDMKPQWRRQFQRFNGQQITPRSLPLDRKLAFISVTLADKRQDAVEAVPALKRLDQRVLSLIFEFSGDPVFRTVKLFDYRGFNEF